MISPHTFREVISGRSKGLKSTLLRLGLRFCEAPYTLAVNLRNRRFDRGSAEVVAVEVPVVSVGNLTLGGTGKTPLVEWICRHLRQQDIRVAIVSRGYGAEQGERNDEALELELALPDVPHLQNPDRVQAAQIAIEELLMQMVVLDDGFQHRRLRRDLDVVLIDATEPFGHEHVFPRGTLREPLEGLTRADAIVLSRADMVGEAEREKIRERAIKLAPTASWSEVVHAPNNLINSVGESDPIESLQGCKIAACCAIGNPSGFRHTLETLGAEIVAWREFPDHHRFDRTDVDTLAQWATGAERVICTRKDLVKLPVVKLGVTPLWALGIRLDFLVGRDELERRLQSVADQVSLSDNDSPATSEATP